MTNRHIKVKYEPLEHIVPDGRLYVINANHCNGVEQRVFVGFFTDSENKSDGSSMLVHDKYDHDYIQPASVVVQVFEIIN